jgi:hypothetical protein
MSRKTNAELQEEVTKLQEELESMRIKLEQALRVVLNVLDDANNSVALHLRTLQLADIDQRSVDL